MSEKPYAATAERLRKARSDGDIPKAQELANVCSFLAIATGVGLSVGNFAQCFAAMYLAAIGRMKTFALQAPSAPAVVLSGTIECANRIELLLLVGSCVGVAVALAVTRGTLQGVSIKCERIAPWPQIKQLFSGATLSALMRASVSAGVAVLFLAPSLVTLVMASTGLRTPFEISTQVWAHLLIALGILACVGISVAGLEICSALRKRGKKLRMSFEELKRESKEQNGDPHLRGLRKRRHRARMSGGPAAARGATVVITNPTHIAVALLYAPPRTPVPIVVASGADDEAREIRNAARDCGVPVIENVALARRLFAQCDVGETIPIETYALVAPIVAAALHVQSGEHS